MTNNLKSDLREAIAHWRKLSVEAELASAETSKPFTQGYLRGIAVTCDNAAKRLEAIIVANRSKIRPAARKVTRRVLHGKQPAAPLA